MVYGMHSDPKKYRFQAKKAFSKHQDSRLEHLAGKLKWLCSIDQICPPLAIHYLFHPRIFMYKFTNMSARSVNM